MLQCSLFNVLQNYKATPTTCSRPPDPELGLRSASTINYIRPRLSAKFGERAFSFAKPNAFPPWSATLTWWWGSAPMTQKISKIWRRGATKSWPNSCRQIATHYQCFCAGFGFTADYGFIAVYLRLYSRLFTALQPLRLHGR